MHTPIKTWLGVTVIIILALSAGMFIWYQQKVITIGDDSGSVISPPIQKACTAEAKQCPDGSYVGRTGPNCEFAPCPEIIGIADKIIIAAPAKDAVISSPVTITGKTIGTWFFEGSFPVEIYDLNDKLLGSGAAEFVPSPEALEWMTEDFVNFSGTITFSSTSSASGYILFKRDNPSGLPQNEESFELLVKFESIADCAKEGESIGAVYPGVVPKKCCEGLTPVIPEHMVGTQGICTKSNGSGWKTYANDNCEYRLEYPAEWIVKETNGGYGDVSVLIYSLETDQKIKQIIKKGIATEGPAPDINIVCFENYKDQPNIKQNNYSIAEYVNDDINFTSPEKISFAGKSAWRARSAGLYYIYVVVIPVGNGLIEISIGYPLDDTIKSISDLPDIYNQILSTFKFID